MNQPNRFHQRVPRLRSNSHERDRRAAGTLSPAASVLPDTLAHDALMQAANVVVPSRSMQWHAGFALALCCGAAFASVAALPARAEFPNTATKAALASPLLTRVQTPQRSRITRANGVAPAKVLLEITPRSSAPRRASLRTTKKMTAFLPPSLPRPSVGVARQSATPKARIVRTIRATSTPQQMRIALADRASQDARVLASGGNTEAAPKLPTVNGRPLRKIITVSALKQLPPASAPLPKNLRAKAISADRFNSRTTARRAQNPGAAPVRQPTRPVTNSDRLSNQIEVSVGTFVVLLTTSDLDTVAVAEPNTADVAVVNSRAVLVNGKTPGVTSLVVVDKFRIRQYQVRVVAAPGSLPRDIAAQIGLSGVGVRQVRDAIVLEGEVANAEEARRATEIAGIYATKVINQLTVRDTSPTANPLAAQLQEAIDIPGVRVRIVGDTTILDGTVESAAQRQRAVTLASTMTKNVVNLIELPRLELEQIQNSLGSLGGAADSSGVPLTARQVGDQIVLEGDVDDAVLSQQAATLAARSGFDVVNRIRVSQVPTEDRAFRLAVEEAIGISGVRVAGNKKLVVLHGTVPNTNDSMRAEQVALSYAGEVQNMMQTPNPILVNVDVSVVEINKNRARALGITFPELGAGQIIGAIGIGPGQGGTNLGTNFNATLRGLVNNNQARLLSNPRMTVLSGRTAGFLVGGQIPIPSGSTTNQAGTSTTIVFKDFGILVNVIPVASSNGVVTMRIYTSVSDIDSTVGGFNFPGSDTTIPAFTVRTAVSEVTVQPGGTIAIGGLISNNVTRIVQRVPFLSKLPILGSLFTSRNFQRNQTELVFFVTPFVMPNPLRAGETAPVTVFAGVDNGGTPTFGTGSVQAGGATTRTVSDGRLGFPPAAGGSNVTGSTGTGGPAGGSAGSQ